MNILEDLNFNDNIITVLSDFSSDCGDCDASMMNVNYGSHSPGDCPCDCRCN